MRSVVSILCLVCIPTILQAQSKTSWTVWSGGAFSQKWVGSQDIRNGAYIGIEFSKAEPRFRYWRRDAELAVEGYYMNTSGVVFQESPFTRANNFGVAVMGRFWNRDPQAIRAYLEIGWGIDYIDRKTYDLDGNINSSPVAGIGTVIHIAEAELLIGVRYKHLSNAGTNVPNRGENYILFLLGTRI